MREDILPILACPICKSSLLFNGERFEERVEKGTLICDEHGHKFPVSDEIALLKSDGSSGEWEWKVDISTVEKREALYEAYRRSLLPDVETAMDAIGDTISKEAAFHRGPIIDIATGMGRLLQTLALRLPSDLLIIGTDVDETVLRGTWNTLRKKQIHSSCSLIATDAKQMGFKNNATDCCVSYHGFSNIPQTRKALAETARILQPDGTLIFSTTFLEEGSMSFEQAKSMGYSEISTEEQLGSTMRKLGFQISSIDELVSGRWPGNPYDALPLKDDHFAMALVTATKPRRM